MTSLTSAKAVNIFITGANRGIGIGLVRELLKEVKNVNTLFAGCRNPDNAKELQSLSNSNPAIKIVEIDVKNDDSIKHAAGINVQQPNRNVFQRHFDVNSTGVAIVTANFLPLLRTAAVSEQTPLVVNISSILGCISRMIPISSLPEPSVIYGMSKAALNYYTKALSTVEPKLISIAFHPGWVRTEMGGTDATLSIEEASSAIVKRILQLKKEDSGKFIDAERDLTF